MRQFRRGMTVLERRAIRDAALQRLLESAYRQAAAYRVTERCQRAMAITGSTPAAAREMHAMCKGEEAPNDGCLCMCHDADRGGITSGMAQEDGRG